MSHHSTGRLVPGINSHDRGLDLESHNAQSCERLAKRNVMTGAADITPAAPDTRPFSLKPLMFETFVCSMAMMAWGSEATISRPH